MFKLYVILSFCQIILTFGKNYLLDFAFILIMLMFAEMRIR